MRIAHVFNLANDGYAICKGLHKIDVDCDLFIERPSHVCSLPQWEDGECDLERLGNPYDPNWGAFRWELPSWIHVWDTRRRGYPFSRVLKWIPLIRMLRNYELVVGHAPFAKIGRMFSRLYRKPYIIYDAGWIRYLPKDRLGYAEARRGYRGAAHILFTNVDTEVMFKEQGYTNQISYTPFAIDTTKYSPTTQEPEHTVFFHPTRQNWAEKNNNFVIEAFAQYVKHDSKAKLVMPDWYQQPDFEKSKELVGSLHLDDNVMWVPLEPKNRLIELYRSSTAVLDQFRIGAMGTTTPEAMSCGVPVITYIEPELWLPYHSTSPPVANAKSAKEICDWMLKLSNNPQLRAEIGRREREWILTNCDDRVVARRQLELYCKVIK
jgi:glycosyltransferase involved in cell wall biosynthesis